MSGRKKFVIEYRHYNLPSDFPVLVLTGERWRISDLKSGRLHFHNCLEIGICRTDSGIMEFEGSELAFREGDITCVPRHLPHTTYSTAGTASLWSYLFVDPAELFRDFYPAPAEDLEFFTEIAQDFHLIMNRADYPKVNFLTETIIEEMVEKKCNYQASVRGLFLSLYIELLRIQNLTGTKNGAALSSDSPLIIAPALAYIDKNYMQPITIGELAELCFISETQFRRVFHSIMNTSPLDYLNSTRIYKACGLMRSTDASILLISEQVGFHSISSFNRCFSKFMETAPRTWRKQMQKSRPVSGKQTIEEFSGWVR